MHRSAQLQFQRLPPEAQRATLWRLAWSGLAPEQIAERTGWSAEQVRRSMHDELARLTRPGRADQHESPVLNLEGADAGDSRLRKSATCFSSD